MWSPKYNLWSPNLDYVESILTLERSEYGTPEPHKDYLFVFLQLAESHNAD
jgi:hypothetical protein